MVRFRQNYGVAAIVAVIIMNSKISRVATDEVNAFAYSRNASLSSNLDLFWTIDSDLATIRVAVHAKAASGWAGLGMSEMGGMDGADIVYYEAETLSRLWRCPDQLQLISGVTLKHLAYRRWRAALIHTAVYTPQANLPSSNVCIAPLRKTDSITDAYSIASGMPVTDECTQDWIFVSGEVGADGLIFEAERALDTGDFQDRVFKDDSVEGASPTTLIAAWGDSEIIINHGTNFVQGQLIMFGGDENSNINPLLGITSNPFFEITAKNFTIPTDRTTYEESCVPAAELPDIDEYHVIGFEAIIQNSTSEYVHHLVLIAYNGSDDCGQSCKEWHYNRSQSTSTSSTTEDDSETPSFCSYDFTYIYLWGPGMANNQLPEDVGFRFGSASGGYTSVEIQTHYNNVDGDEGMVDSSGIRTYYTEDMRPMDMGVLVLGDPNVELDGTPILGGKSFAAFECPGSCTEKNFEVESVTVHSHVLHMHENGQRMITRQYREDGEENEVLVHTTEVEYYSFLQAAGYVTMVNDSTTIQKGDRFETECHYDTALSSISTDGVEFGLGSEDEMCIDFLYYYPKQHVPYSGSCGYGYCDGDMTGYSALEDDSNFNRTFGISSCGEEDQEISSEDHQSSSASTLPGFVIFAFTAAVTLVLTGK